MGTLKDVRGEVYNRFTIIENLPSIKYGIKNYKRVKARCVCGNERELCYRDLKRGKAKSCGCLAKEIKTKVNEGDIFNFWTVIKETEGYFYKREKTGRKFLCKCICGKEKEVNLQSLKKENSKSCGCKGVLPKEKIIKEKFIPQDTEDEQWKESITYPGYYISTLGRIFNYDMQYMFPLKTSYEVKYKNKRKYIIVIKEMYKTFIGDYDETMYEVVLLEDFCKVENLTLINKRFKNKLKGVYANMKSRCYNKKCLDYKSYGGKGIIIEDSFSNVYKFCKWAESSGYNLGLEIDRENNNGNYSSENCRWITKDENLLNMGHINLTIDDVKYIRSENFDINNPPERFTCSKFTLDNIINYKTFKNI